jgi:hypothetical protein
MIGKPFAVVTALALVVLAPAAGYGQSKSLKLGEKYEGELKKDNFSNGAYQTDVRVSLKAGQSLSITATVVGSDRTVALNVLDTEGKLIEAPGCGVFTKTTAQITVEEVGATGFYTIRVHSTRVGAFTLKATASSEKELDEKALKAEIEELEKTLADRKAKLKALQQKKSK